VLSREVEKVAAIVGHSLLGKMQLPLHLRGDEQDIGGHKKKELLGDCWRSKSDSFPLI
jgi:hypothetical protein